MRLVAHPDGEAGKKYVLCRSAARAEKERAMLQHQSDGSTAALIKIDAWLRRAPQRDLEAVGRRIGRVLGKYPAAAALVQAEVQADAHGCAAGLQIANELAAGQKAHRQKGAYLLRTNCEETNPAQLWRRYI